MNKMKLKYQISLFGDFDNIQQTPDTVKKLMEVMQKFDSYNLLLNTMNEITIDSRTGTPKQVNRISFIDQNSGFQIMFGSRRLDFVKELRTENGENLGELEEYIELVTSIITELSEEFDNFKNFNRLSLITDSFINDLGDEKIDSIYKKLLNKIFFSDQSIAEWNTRIVDKREGANLQEQINSILSVDRVQGQLIVNNNPQVLDGIKVLLDVNTQAEDTSFRFNLDSINKFLIDASHQFNLIYQDIDNKLLKD